MPVVHAFSVLKVRYWAQLFLHQKFPLKLFGFGYRLVQQIVKDENRRNKRWQRSKGSARRERTQISDGM